MGNKGDCYNAFARHIKAGVGHLMIVCYLLDKIDHLMDIRTYFTTENVYFQLIFRMLYASYNWS